MINYKPKCSILIKIFFSSLFFVSCGDDEQLQENTISDLLIENGEQIQDIEGNIYSTIIVDEQQWMAENLRVGKLNSGQEIPVIESINEWRDLNSIAYCIYDNNISNEAIYGNLYAGYIIDGNYDVCPLGWRIPNSNDWEVLIENLGGIDSAGSALKKTGNDLWVQPNNDATNRSMFTALPSGDRSGSGNYNGIGVHTGFWSSSLAEPGRYYTYWVGFNFPQVSVLRTPISHALPIRCIRE